MSECLKCGEADETFCACGRQSEMVVASSELVLPQPDSRVTELREAFAEMEQEQWDEYQEYVKRCGGVPISKIKASRPVRQNS